MLSHLFGLASAVASPVTEVLRPLVGVGRHVSARDDRAHIEVHGLHRPGAEETARGLERSLTELDGVRSTEVNAVLGRVTVTHEPDLISSDDLVGHVAAAEREHGLDGAAPAGSKHPADVDGVLREVVGAASRGSFPVHVAAWLAIAAGTWWGSGPARLPAPVPAERTPWHAMSTDAALARLDSSPDDLTEAESRRRVQPESQADSEQGLVRATAEELANPLTSALARAVSLAVASVPEGLPFVATVAGWQPPAGCPPAARNPSTIEALGRVDVLCFDKTGTLTKGKIARDRRGSGAAGAGSMAALATIVTVPGVSHFFGCLPLLPHQWGLALASSAAATGAAVGWQQFR